MATRTFLTHRRRTSLLALAGFLAICAVVATTAAAATQRSVRVWYPTLHKPGFTPPDWAFPIAWTVLYILMAVAAWRVWRRGERSDTAALTLWFLQLALNFAWSVLFFGLHLIAAGLIDIAALLVLILLTTAAFWRRDRAAGALMVPYALWVTFALALNFAIWRLNPGA